jgi:hypothetical protein
VSAGAQALDALTEYFPYGNLYYGILYRLSFLQQEKTVPGDGPLKLVSNSVIGRVELEFEGL